MAVGLSYGRAGYALCAQRNSDTNRDRADFAVGVTASSPYALVHSTLSSPCHVLACTVSLCIEIYHLYHSMLTCTVSLCDDMYFVTLCWHVLCHSVMTVLCHSVLTCTVPLCDDGTVSLCVDMYFVTLCWHVLCHSVLSMSHWVDSLWPTLHSYMFGSLVVMVTGSHVVMVKG